MADDVAKGMSLGATARFFLWMQLVCTSLGCVFFACLLLTQPVLMQPLLALFSAWMALGIVAPVLILRGRQSAWWLEMLWVLPLTAMAVAGAQDINFSPDFRGMMRGISDVVITFFLIGAPIECLRRALQKTNKPTTDL